MVVGYKVEDANRVSANAGGELDTICDSQRRAVPIPPNEPEAASKLKGNSESMRSVFDMVRRVAPSNVSVLIGGESGTGKTELARLIHSLSPRRSAPFVSLSCASLAESLLETELFGHEKGAFTGAERRRLGRFEQAHQGTLFLDEIGDVSPAIQVKLLNVLQDRVLQRVGGNETVRVDVRIIAATHRDLREYVSQGRFRADLYYRLNVVHLRMPPLRERGNDIPLLAHAFLARFAQQNGKVIWGFTREASDLIARYSWPGNVRELENAIERAVVLCDGDHVSTCHLPACEDRVLDSEESGVRIPGTSLASMERFLIVKTLEAVGGSTTRAAQVLQISVRTLQQRLQQYGLSRGRGRPHSERPHIADVADPGKSGFSFRAAERLEAQAAVPRRK